MNLYAPVIVKKQLDDEHYYFVDGLFRPSVTKILQEAMPTPFALRQWIGDVGNEKAAEKLNRAGERGTSIHDTCGRLLKGAEIDLAREYPARQDKKVIVGFINWMSENNPQFTIENIERTVASELGYAGTMDFFCTIKDEPWLIDFKTSAGVYDSHKLQLAAYRQAWMEMTGIWANIGILHLTPKVKKGYTFHDDLAIEKKPVETEDFQVVLEMYKMLHGGVIPEPDLTELYPPTVKLITFEEPKGGEH